MKFLFTALVTLTLLFSFSCGEEGVGFNIRKEFPVDIPVDSPFEGIGIDLPGNPPPVEPFRKTYKLGDVDAFNGDLEFIEEVVFENLHFEIDSVSAEEELPIDELLINVILKNGEELTLLKASEDLSGKKLEDTPKTRINLSNDDLEALAESLTGSDGEVTSEILFDFGEFPDEDINFIFRLYFDVTVKVRDL